MLKRLSRATVCRMNDTLNNVVSNLSLFDRYSREVVVCVLSLIIVATG